jgi:hypothetical protein
VRVRGDAFVHTESDADLPSVTIAAEGARPRDAAGRPLARRPRQPLGLSGVGRTAATAASRARSCCRLATRRGGSGSSWGGQAAEHQARLLPAAGRRPTR